MTGATVKVLHIEDNLTDAELMQEIMQNGVGNTGQYDVVHVENLNAALSQIASQGFDVVLLGLNLKDISSIDTIAAISEENPDLQVIILSGEISDSIVLEAIDRGAQEYVIKGHCDGKILHIAIQSSIKRKTLERRLFRQANYDTLTELPNRKMFQVILKRPFARQEGGSAGKF